MRKEKVNVNDYTIEHIMPQNPNLSSQWQTDLGEKWKEIQQKYLHTLGNLTLTAYNSEYSDHSFSYKRDQVKNEDGDSIGLASSPLNLNKNLGQVEKWDEEQIEKRVAHLANLAVKTWSIPNLTKEQLSYYQSLESTKLPYDISDHPHLMPNSAMHHLFQALRQQILAFDSCISEEFLKLYVAYKAETNFVDIIPQAKRLRLVLNMQFAHIQDPRGLCRDITNIGKWGNGDVEVNLDNFNDLSYVMGLIRQSFDYQIAGN